MPGRHGAGRARPPATAGTSDRRWPGPPPAAPTWRRTAGWSPPGAARHPSGSPNAEAGSVAMPGPSSSALAKPRTAVDASGRSQQLPVRAQVRIEVEAGLWTGQHGAHRPELCRNGARHAAVQHAAQPDALPQTLRLGQCPGRGALDRLRRRRPDLARDHGHVGAQTRASLRAREAGHPDPPATEREALAQAGGDDGLVGNHLRRAEERLFVCRGRGLDRSRRR